MYGIFLDKFPYNFRKQTCRQASDRVDSSEQSPKRCAESRNHHKPGCGKVRGRDLAEERVVEGVAGKAALQEPRRERPLRTQKVVTGSGIRTGRHAAVSQRRPYAHPNQRGASIRSRRFVHGHLREFVRSHAAGPLGPFRRGRLVLRARRGRGGGLVVGTRCRGSSFRRLACIAIRHPGPRHGLGFGGRVARLGGAAGAHAHGASGERAEPGRLAVRLTRQSFVRSHQPRRGRRVRRPPGASFFLRPGLRPLGLSTGSIRL